MRELEREKERNERQTKDRKEPAQFNELPKNYIIKIGQFKFTFMTFFFYFPHLFRNQSDVLRILGVRGRQIKSVYERNIHIYS